MKTIEEWKAAKETPDWLFNATKASTPGWAIGREVDEKTYDAAVDRTANHRYHAHPPAKAAPKPAEEPRSAQEAPSAPPETSAAAVIDDRPAKPSRK